MGCALAINDDVANLIKNLAEVKPTVLYAVPRIFNRLYDGVNKQIAEKPGMHLPTMQAIVTQIIGYKADFFDFVGLPEAAGFVHKYVAAAEKTKSIAELAELTGAALSYANRIHMWIDAVFPWGLGNGFKRADRKDVV